MGWWRDGITEGSDCTEGDFSVLRVSVGSVLHGIVSLARTVRLRLDGNDKREVAMDVTELLQAAQFLVDANGNKKAVVFDFVIWEELLTLIEDLEDAEEIRRLREAGEEAVTWEQAKAELRGEGIDV